MLTRQVVLTLVFARLVFIEAFKRRSWLGPNSFFEGQFPSPRSFAQFLPLDKKVYLFGGISSDTSFNEIHQWNPSTMTWTDLSDSISGLAPLGSNHGSAIANGKLYVLSLEYNSQEAMVHSELLHQWDPVSMRWSDITSRVVGAFPRPWADFTLVGAGGNLYSYSVNGDIAYNDLFLFELDPIAMRWTALTSTTGAPPQALTNHGLVAQNDCLIFIGGYDDTDDEHVTFEGLIENLYRWDPATLHWSNLTGRTRGALPEMRAGFGLAATDRVIYLFGGSKIVDGASPVYLNDLYALDTAALEWTLLAAGTIAESTFAGDGAPSPRSHAALAYAGDGQLYIFGGFDGSVLLSDIYKWDSHASAWVDLSSGAVYGGPSARSHLGFTVAGGLIYIFGGAEYDGSTSRILDDFYTWNPSTLRWTNLTNSADDAPSIRYKTTMAAINTSVYLFGGYDAANVLLNDFFVWNHDTMTWTNLSLSVVGEPPMPSEYGASAELDGKLYLCGSFEIRSDSADLFNDKLRLFEWDPRTMAWTDLGVDVLGTPPSLREGHGFTSLQGRLYVFGGYISEEFESLNDLYEWDPVSRAWTDLTSRMRGVVPSPRSGLGFAAAGGQLFLFGGYDDHSAVLNDFHTWNPATLAWIRLSSDTVAGAFPAPRSDFGLAITEGRLYGFGGWGGNENIDQFFCITLPQKHTWPSDGSLVSLISVFDWDNIVVKGDNNLLGPWHVTLCYGAFPCKLDIAGHGQGTITRCPETSISCSFNAGCAGVTFDSLRIICMDGVASTSLLRFVGSELTLVNSSFAGCSSSADGSIISARDYSHIRIQSCLFQNLYSEGYGGSLAAFGSIVYISDTKFLQCVAVGGGGALFISSSEAYRDDSAPLVDAAIFIDSSLFLECQTKGSGGALRVSSNCQFEEIPVSKEQLLLQISSTIFNRCLASGDGGGIWADGGFVIMQALNSSFVSCTSDAAGGAISANNFAQMMIFKSLFEQNYVEGPGGGALHANNAHLTIVGSACRANTATLGGGGALFWTGEVSPRIFAWCSSGSRSFECTSAECFPACTKCTLGTFQTGEGMISDAACVQCEPGTFASAEGSTICASCQSGKYSTIVGAHDSSVCSACIPGSFSHEGSSECSACEAGTYSNMSGAITCSFCRFGQYSTIVGAVDSSTCAFCDAGEVSGTGASSCIVCHPGKYSDAIGASECLSCQDGQYSTEFGAINSSTCVECEPGKYAYGGDSMCYLCEAGTYASMLGSSTCSACPRGTYLDFEGATNWTLCIMCEPGAFSGRGSSSCTLCDAGTYSEVSSATSCLTCLAGKYSTALGANDSVSCLPCPPQLCSNPGASSCSVCELSTEAEVVRVHENAIMVQWLTSSGVNARPRHPFKGRTGKIHRKQKRSLRPSKSSKYVDVFQYVCSPAGGRQVAQFLQHSMYISNSRMKSHNSTPQQSEEGYLLGSDTVDRGDTFCGPHNSALYGQCLASTFKYLDVSGIPTASSKAYPGLPIRLTVLKLDFYHQVIASDSTSLLQTLTTSSSQLKADPSVLLSGETSAGLQAGEAELSIEIRPTYLEVLPDSWSTNIKSTPYIYIQGYILNLDQSHQGACLECGLGTYSLFPLAGTARGQPSCFNCPAGGDCRGGSQVSFSLGRWTAVAGMYVLVGCPSGYSLVNSIGGSFSHDVQRCTPCRGDQYILDSNNSLYTCQTCPTGASCDGSSLKGTVAGSIWSADWSKGIYRLESCPMGYLVEKSSDVNQKCSLWTSPLYVAATVSLPVVKSTFNITAFRQAIARAAAVRPDLVAVDTVVEDGRRADGVLTAAAAAEAVRTVRVGCRVAADNATAAYDISGRLMSPVFNRELESEGIPPATAVSVAILAADGSSYGGSAIPLSVVIGASVGGFVALIVLAVGGMRLVNDLKDQAARREFQAAVKSAKAGDVATQAHLPVGLRGDFVAEKILGKGAFGLVMRARQRDGGKLVAIKAVLPGRGGAFADAELRSLVREANVLSLMAATRCEHAVHLVGLGAVQLGQDVGWFVLELAEGGDMASALAVEGPLHDIECIRVARAVLAALKVMHSEGLVHRDIKPANIVRCPIVVANNATSTASGTDVGDQTVNTVRRGSASAGRRASIVGVSNGIAAASFLLASGRQGGEGWMYKVTDFGTVLGVDETLASEAMMTFTDRRAVGAGTPAYMSPEMFLQPARARYPTDLWSLGVTLFELSTGRLPFRAETELLWGAAVAGDMCARAPNLMDALEADRRAKFDSGLAKVVAQALEKQVEKRYQSVDEMHDAVYSCLINRGEAFYSVFISYRFASEAPLARLLFDDLNHSVTPGGHRVTVYWDAPRFVKGEDWEEGVANGLLHSLCFVPLLSYGATAPLADIPDAELPAAVARGWEAMPVGRARLRGLESDPEDNVLKEILIAEALLDRRTAGDRRDDERGLLEVAYPVLVGRPHPEGHQDYPRMGTFFEVQAGGGRYPVGPSPPTGRAVERFLRDRANLPPEAAAVAAERGVAAAMGLLTGLQGRRLWDHEAKLGEADLSREQSEGLVGQGYAGPPVDLAGQGVVPLTEVQLRKCGEGLDLRQLRMLKAQVRASRADFHEVIDRAISTRLRRFANALATDSSVTQSDGSAEAHGADSVAVLKGSGGGGVGGGLRDGLAARARSVGAVSAADSTPTAIPDVGRASNAPPSHPAVLMSAAPTDSLWPGISVDLVFGHAR